MLPRRASAKDLYACRARVQIPNIKINRPNGRHKSGPDSAAANSIATPPPPPGSGRSRLRRHTVGDAQSSLRAQVGELRQTLRFSEDVVSSRSPQSVSYGQARDGLSRVFLPVSRTSRRRRVQFPELTGDVGQHNCRGEPRKHPLCHLHSVQTAAPQLDRKWEGLGRQRTDPTRRVPSLPGDIHHGNIPSYPSNMLYHYMRVVPTSESVQWEEEALKTVTSSTAVRLRNTKKCRGREGKGEKGGTNAVMERGELRSAFGDEVEVESDECVSVVQDYVTSLERGAKPLFLGAGRKGREGRRGRRDIIVLDSETTFDKVLQSSYPQQPSQWCEGPPEIEDQCLVRGNRRWTDLPQPAPTPERLRWVRGREHSPTPDSLPEDGGVSPLPSQRSSAQWHHCNILRKWSRKCSIHVHPEDICEAVILQNIHSHNNSSRLRGIAACSYLAARQENGYHASWEEGMQGGEGGGRDVVSGLEKLLDDVSASVCVPAAIALHCLGEGSKKAVDVLLTAVHNVGCDFTDEWAALQCLVECGICDECVVERLQRYLLNSADPSHRERAGQLMARLSDRMPLVHALLAEQLTSRGWQERLSACHILPTLLCPLSTDVCSRLVVMSWEDWSGVVRYAASQALGKTGNSKLLHDELVRRLSGDVEVQRLDALRKLHYLELMTPQLLSAFLPSLSDQHASIRTEAIAICGRLALGDSAVIQQLVRLLGDPVWNIRAHALRALKSIGCCGSEVMEQLLWAVRCDKVAAVRAEACHTLGHLWGKEQGVIKDSRLISTLRDRLVVEDDTMVAHELTLALRQLGGQEEREDPLLNSIRTQLQALGTGQAITQAVLDNDRAALTDYVIARPLVHPTTRDYLTSHQRHKFYSEATLTTTHAMKGAGSAIERVWSPDRETIDKHLAVIQQSCTISLAPE